MVKSGISLMRTVLFGKAVVVDEAQKKPIEKNVVVSALCVFCSSCDQNSTSC
jgi:hypothetical protein